MGRGRTPYRPTPLSLTPPKRKALDELFTNPQSGVATGKDVVSAPAAIEESVQSPSLPSTEGLVAKGQLQAFVSSVEEEERCCCKGKRCWRARSAPPTSNSSVGSSNATSQLVSNLCRMYQEAQCNGPSRILRQNFLKAVAADAPILRRLGASLGLASDQLRRVVLHAVGEKNEEGELVNLGSVSVDLYDVRRQVDSLKLDLHLGNAAASKSTSKRRTARAASYSNSSVTTLPVTRVRGSPTAGAVKLGGPLTDKVNANKAPFTDHMDSSSPPPPPPLQPMRISGTPMWNTACQPPPPPMEPAPPAQRILVPPRTPLPNRATNPLTPLIAGSPIVSPAYPFRRNLKVVPNVAKVESSQLSRRDSFTSVCSAASDESVASSSLRCPSELQRILSPVTTTISSIASSTTETPKLRSPIQRNHSVEETIRATHRLLEQIAARIGCNAALTGDDHSNLLPSSDELVEVPRY